MRITPHFTRHSSNRLKASEALGPEVSVLKLHQTELYQRITEAMLDMAGEEAGLQGHLPGTSAAVAEQFLHARPTTIFGGTSEVQRNILALRVLDLPK